MAGEVEIGRRVSCDPFIMATTKGCPGCGFRATHYHGHACHHVKDGCRECGIQYCYSCLATQEQNVKEREEEYQCLCEEGWSNFCVSDGSTAENILCDPYPRDKRCGCPICPDCKKGQPCEMCFGKKYMHFAVN